MLSDDETLYEYKFELLVRAGVEEEPQWYNSTHVVIKYLQPPCEVSQADIDLAAGKQQIVLEAQEKIGEDSISVQDLIYLARDAMKIGQRTFCGQMLYALEAAEPFMTLERSTELLIMQPRSVDLPGDYNESYMRFYFDQFPDVGLNVPIHATITECFYLNSQFRATSQQADYIMGEPPLRVDLPVITGYPDCGTPLSMTFLSLRAESELPGGKD